MERLTKLRELNLLYKAFQLAKILGADVKTVRRWLYTENAYIHQQRHRDNIDLAYENSKGVIKMRKANRDRINGVMI